MTRTIAFALALGLTVPLAGQSISASTLPSPAPTPTPTPTSTAVGPDALTTMDAATDGPVDPNAAVTTTTTDDAGDDKTKALADKTAAETYAKLVADTQAAQTAAAKAQTDYVKSLLPAAPTVDPKDNAGQLEVSILAARAVDYAADQISAHLRPTMCVTAGSKGPAPTKAVLLFSGGPTLTTAHYDTFKARIAQLDSEFETAKALYLEAQKAYKKGHPSTKMAFAILPFPNVSTVALGALSAFSTDYTVGGVSAPSDEDARLVLDFYNDLSSCGPVVTIGDYPTDLQPGATDEIKNDIAEVVGNGRKMMTYLSELRGGLAVTDKGDLHDILDLAATAAQTYVTDLIALQTALAASDGAMPLPLVIKEARIVAASNGDAWGLFVKPLHTYGGMITRKTILSLFAGIPMKVSAGLEVQYYLVRLKDGKMLAADAVTVATGYRKLDSVKADIPMDPAFVGNGRRYAPPAPSRTDN